MTTEEMQHARLHTIAMIAATLAAGEATERYRERTEMEATYYVRDATDLFDAVEASEAKRQADLVNAQGPF